MDKLHDTIDMIIRNSNSDKTIIQQIKKEDSISPFPVEARLLAYLQSIDAITYNQYNEIYNDYKKLYLSENKYLYLFDLAPRTFGQTWGEQHIRSLFPQFQKATKELLAEIYPHFDGEFDLWLDGIRVEVKACRANNTKTDQMLSSRAYSHKEARAAGFKYHFQQIKPSCCDVFIWIGACKDELLYWILSSKEVQCTEKLGPQHRNINTGIAGIEVFEGQVFMTEEELSPFQISEQEILNAVLKK